MDPMAAGIELVPLARVSIGGGERYDTGTSPFGRRVIVGIASGRWDGERLSGDIVGPGGDWAMPVAGDLMLLDVRQVLRTDDGAIIHVSYTGRCDRTRGTYTVAPTFQTGDDRYAWINRIQAIGQGRMTDGVLRYDMYEIR